MTLDFFSGEAYLAKTIVEKLRFFRSDEYYLQFYDDVSNAARCLDWSHQYCRRRNIDMTELIVQIYENAIAYAQYVCNGDFPEIALNSVINEIANLHYRDVDDLSSLIAPHYIYLKKNKPYGGVSSVTEEVGVVIESMCAVLCFDYMKQKDDRVIDALYNMRMWVYHRSGKGFPVYPHWHFWNLLAERIPDNRYPSEGELRQRIKKLETENEKLKQEVLALPLEGQCKNDENQLVDKYRKEAEERFQFLKEEIKPFFSEEDDADTFLTKAIEAKAPTDITDLVNAMVKSERIKFADEQKKRKSRLWQILYYSQIYKASQSNWNNLIDR